MPYYMAIETKLNDYTAINIKKTKEYKKIFQSDEAYECTLEEIDRFTSRYHDKKSLTYDLCGEGVLGGCYYNGSLAIVCAENEQISWIEKSFLFKSSKQYLENPSLVINYIKQKTKELDFSFFKELATSTNVSEQIANFINTHSVTIEQLAIIKSDQNQSDIISSLLNHLDTIAEVLAKLLINDSKVSETGEITLTDQLNYQKFRNLLIFISDYELQNTKAKNTCPKKVKPTS